MIAALRQLPFVDRSTQPRLSVGAEGEQSMQWACSGRPQAACGYAVFQRGSLVSLWTSAGIDLTSGRVMLLTFPRVLGARFYPVSFWYCFGADGTPLAVMAEVHNTYGDRHNYLLHNCGQPFDFTRRPTAAKAFFVSPFIQREDVTYEFAFGEPAEDLSVSIRDIVSGSHMLTAAINLKARELTDSTLMAAVLHHGPISIVALLRIHWQALRLLLKRVPLFPHTPPPAEELSS